MALATKVKNFKVGQRSKVPAEHTTAKWYVWSIRDGEDDRVNVFVEVSSAVESHIPCQEVRFP